ncbi:GntR family transcriptional regulator [Xanthomonas sp. Kuri4-1]
MSAVHSKRALVYRQVRYALRSGRYVPGQRIDPAGLARECRTSPTPVRFALYRLVGEGLVADHARNGLHVPLPTELALHDLYDWMQRLLLMACELCAVPDAPRPAEAGTAAADDDVVKRTWQLFNAIAQANTHRFLQLAIRQANDRLAPIRRAKHGLFEHAQDELAELSRHWQARDLPALRTALRGYHEQRRQRVPRIVALLHEQGDDPR